MTSQNELKQIWTPFLVQSMLLTLVENTTFSVAALAGNFQETFHLHKFSYKIENREVFFLFVSREVYRVFHQRLQIWPTLNYWIYMKIKTIWIRSLTLKYFLRFSPLFFIWFCTLLNTPFVLTFSQLFADEIPVRIRWLKIMTIY